MAFSSARMTARMTRNGVCRQRPTRSRRPLNLSSAARTCWACEASWNSATSASVRIRRQLVSPCRGAAEHPRHELYRRFTVLDGIACMWFGYWHVDVQYTKQGVTDSGYHRRNCASAPSVGAGHQPRGSGPDAIPWHRPPGSSSVAAGCSTAGVTCGNTSMKARGPAPMAGERR